MEWSISLLRHFKIQTLLKINCCMAAISAFRVMQHSQIFSLFFRNRIQCIALYQLYNSQALLNLRCGYYSYSSHICYGKQFCNDFFLNHNTIALVRNCLKLLSCVVIETALDGMKESIILTVSFQLENVPFNIKSYRFECNDCNACSQTIMTHHFAFGYLRNG